MKSLELFWRFFLLGWVSFGGPAAHIGYFHATFVQKLRWLDQAAYTRLIALSQFLPGPGSSQIGFTIGLQRSGIIGGIAAFMGFTLPSFMMMYLLATMAFEQTEVFIGLVHGLKLFAVVIVADAVVSMYKNFCTSVSSITLAVGSAVLLWIIPSLWTQMGVLVLAGFIGTLALRPSLAITDQSTTIRPSYLPLIVFAAIFAGLPLLTHTSVWIDLFNTFYQSGSLVFGGGHVVLPLLQQSLGDSVSTERFLFGYALAQAIPGPMFAFASFLGADLISTHPFIGALVATIAIFLPGFLLVLGFHNAWESLSLRPRIAGAAAGINAAVVGLLIAVLYSPVFLSAVISPFDIAMVVIGFYLLRIIRMPIIGLLPLFALISLIRNLLS